MENETQCLENTERSLNYSSLHSNHSDILVVVVLNRGKRVRLFYLKVFMKVLLI